jgi:hypothetical protein
MAHAENNSISVSDLAERIRLSPIRTSRLAIALGRQGLAERRRDSADARSTRIAATDAGRDRLREPPRPTSRPSARTSSRASASATSTSSRRYSRGSKRAARIHADDVPTPAIDTKAGVSSQPPSARASDDHEESEPPRDPVPASSSDCSRPRPAGQRARRSSAASARRRGFETLAPPMEQRRYVRCRRLRRYSVSSEVTAHLTRRVQFAGHDHRNESAAARLA